MRIALVAPLVGPISQPYLGGAQAMVADLARGLVQRGHQVTLFAREGSAVPDVTLRAITVPDSVQPTNFARADQEGTANDGFFDQANVFLDLFLQLRQLRQEFDLVHCHAFDWPAFTLSPLVEELPLLHTIHLPAIISEINTALRVLHQRGHPLTLIAPSYASAATYAPYTEIDRVVYNGLDLAAIPFVERVDDDAPLLFAGRITPEKGVVEAIDIARRAGRPLLIAGGIYDQEYYEMVVRPRMHQEQGHVRYLGQLNHQELWNLMGQVSGLLFPITWDEPFGLTPVEAMATGTPVIAFARGAAGEVVRDGETGFLVAPGDCQQAATLVSALPSLSRERCRAHVITHFSRERMLAEYEQIYREVIS